MSRSIVAEPLNYEAPGNLKSGTNYLEFRSPDECVEKVSQLFSDKELRYHMMAQNLKYYHSYLRPDSLVLNTILAALSNAPDRIL